MAPIVLLTSRSSACSAARTSAGAVDRRSSQVGQRCPSLSIRAVPTISLKIEPRWLPPPERDVPRCCERRFQSVVRDPAFKAWVPTRTIRGPVPLSVRYSPVQSRNRRLAGARSACRCNRRAYADQQPHHSRYRVWRKISPRGRAGLSSLENHSGAAGVASTFIRGAGGAGRPLPEIGGGWRRRDTGDPVKQPPPPITPIAAAPVGANFRTSDRFPCRPPLPIP